MIIYFVLTSCGNNGKTNGNATTNIVSKDISVTLSNDLLKKYEMAMNEGENLFKNNCAVCHCSTTGTCEPSEMPHFRNLFNRLPQDSLQVIIEYISNSKKLKDAGNKFAIQVDLDYPHDFEHNFQQKLTESETKNVVLYLWLPCVTRK